MKKIKNNAIKLILLLSIFFVPISNSHAALIPVIHKDTLTELDVSWTWNPEVFGVSSIPALSNWKVSLVISALSGDQNLDYTVTLDAEHTKDPHPDTESGGGEKITYTKKTDLNFFGEIFGVFPDIGQVETTDHHTGHKDVYEFFFRRSGSPTATKIRLTGSHTVPTPGTLVLFAIGLIAMISIKIEKKLWRYKTPSI